jgi:uncharacterized lipoprotein YddW (UPF0748 family)
MALRSVLPLFLLLSLALAARPQAAAAALDLPPSPPREFRGVWIATVANIDWPSKRGLSTEQQKAELTDLLDRAARARLNAVVFQVRPSCDAFYDSPYEPWSEYLTGQMGRAPSPYYDPLAFAVEEAHRRGLELHAWFNPYRAHHAISQSPLAPNHVSKTRPELVRQYGRYLWLDPGEKAVQDYSIQVIMDVVRRYDIDGVHLDDYFYPYQERGPGGGALPFPDGSSWQKYVRSGGALGRDDWRRENVNTFIERLYREIKKEKRWVKFGISPFGIWRPGYPASVRGLDPYAELYADSRRWLVNGWVDYFTPQLYWRISQPNQSYTALLKWWAQQNPGGRHLWPGNNTNGSVNGSWPASEIVSQIERTRDQPGAGGNVHFSAKFLKYNPSFLATLVSEVYSRPALVPASPWLDADPPRKPELALGKPPDPSRRFLTWKETGKEKAWLWVVQRRAGGKWSTEILPGGQASLTVSCAGASAPDLVAVSAVDRCGNQSPPAVVSINGKEAKETS